MKVTGAPLLRMKVYDVDTERWAHKMEERQNRGIMENYNGLKKMYPF